MNDTVFYRGENPLRADKLNTALSERVARSGDSMQGRLNLIADPVAPLEAATKQYVDRFTSMGVPTGAYIGAAPPGNVLGPLWWDSVSGQLFIQYNDGSSTQWVSANSIDASTLEGSFLPITGGTMSGPLNYTATGGTVSRAAQDRAVEAISVKDFGAKGDGTTNDTAALQAAADAIPANGGGLMFPPGRYAVTGSVRLSSNTSVIGTGATLLAISGFPINTAFLVNKNNSVTVLTDHDISVRGMTFDYATFGTGGSHAISMNFASNILIADCIFQCRGNAGNATACVGCVNTRIDGCSAYDFINCAYDHWWGPKRAFLVNCYAESASPAQMINFNPEPSSGPSTGLVASGFVMANCMLRGTGSGAIPMQVEPLGAGTSVTNINIHGNVFTNLFLSMRRAVSNVVVSGNVFDGCPGGIEVIRTYTADGGVPSGIMVVNNIVNNPMTTGPSYAVIRVEAAPAVVMGNSVIGTGWSGYAYGTSTFAAIFLGNVGGPHHTPSATGGAGPPTWTA